MAIEETRFAKWIAEKAENPTTIDCWASGPHHAPDATSTGGMNSSRSGLCAWHLQQLQS
jgi:hypothetical protein